MTKTVYRTLAAALVLVATAFIWHASADGRTQTPSRAVPTPVRVAPVATEDFRPTETFAGIVRGVHQAEIAPKAGGTVVSLLKEPGESVRAGETLAVLDGAELSAADRSAGLVLEAARVSLRRARDYYRQKVDEAEANLEKTKKDRDNGHATDKDVDVAKESLESARRLRDAETARAEADAAVAEGGKDLSGTNARNTVVIAPFSGVVTVRNVSVGSFVAPGTAIYTVASPENLEVEVSVPARVAAVLRPGMPVTAVSEGAEQPLSGSVFSVAKAVRPSTGETPVRIRLSEADGPALPFPGQSVRVALPSGPERKSVLIPESAIVREYDDTFVFTVDDGRARKRNVALGQADGGRREILSGLETGSSLVVEGMHGLKETMNVDAYATE
jgi:RND family efflux transporter MFP subunit